MSNSVPHHRSRSATTAAALFAIALTCTSCAVSYRHQVHNSVHTREDGRFIEIEGEANSGQLMTVADFRFFRLGAPVELSKRALRFVDDGGSTDRFENIRERRIFRADVPLISFWSPDSGVLSYPGLMKHRRSLEMWLGAETEFAPQAEWFADGSLVYYWYNAIGVRLFGGVGSVPFRAATPQIGQRFPEVWEGRAPNVGFGIELLLPAGEYALDILDYLLEFDQRHRDRYGNAGDGSHVSQ